jgi:hypothetical protein
MADTDNSIGKIHSYELLTARTRLALLQKMLPQDCADPTGAFYNQIKESLACSLEFYGTKQLTPTQELEQDIAIRQILEHIIDMMATSLAIDVKVEEDVSLPIQEAFVPYLSIFLDLKSQLDTGEQNKIRQLMEELEEEDEEEQAEIAYDRQESEHLLELILQGIEEIDDILHQIAEEATNNDLQAAQAIIHEYLSVKEEIEPGLFRECFIRPSSKLNPSNEITVVAEDAEVQEITPATQHN